MLHPTTLRIKDILPLIILPQSSGDIDISPNVMKTQLLETMSVRAIYFLTFLMLTQPACSQQLNDRTLLGKAHAEKELKSVLGGKIQHNIIDHETTIIKDSVIAISIAEPILFSIYGKDNIIRQRPYEVYFINNHWIISGTLPKNSDGGTFLIIMDARDNKILRITHGK